MTKLLLFGANGQLGHRLAEAADCVPITRAEMDFTALDTRILNALIDTHEPTHIVNTAAFTAVDLAETQPELAYAVNALAPSILAQLAQARGIPFIHCSTDYVFDGTAGPYVETARPNPINQYGKSKLHGEQAALDAGAHVFRLQWLYDTRGTNFLRTMQGLIATRDQLTVVADQWGTPSYAPHIARALLQAMHIPAGLYHLVPQGYTSWHGFACAIAEGSNCTIAPITSEEYPRPANRPRDARLSTDALAAHGITLPHWRDGLKEALHGTA